jgi:hypothetical protein
MTSDPNEPVVEESIPDTTFGETDDGESPPPLGRRGPIVPRDASGPGPEPWRLWPAIEKHPWGFMLIVIGGAVLIGWSIIAPTHWTEIVKSQSRLGYLVGDGFLVAPGCILAGWGLLRDHSWGPAATLIVIGAAAFDLTHTFIYMAEVHFPKFGGSPPPIWAYVACILVIWGFLNWLAWRVIRLKIKGNSGLEPWSWLKGFIPSVILVIIVVTLGYALT